MPKKITGWLAVLALFVGAAYAQPQEPTQPQPAAKPPAPPAIKTHLKVGDKAPDFTLMGVDGKEVKLSKLRKKSNVVLAFYPKAFTGG